MERINKILALALGLSIVVVACSAPAVPDSNSSDPSATTTKKDASSTSTPTDSTDTSDGSTGDPVDTSDGGTDPTTDGGAVTDCTSTTTYDTCLTCCDAPTGGELKAASDAFDTCSCGSGGQCASACSGTYCNGQDPSSACETCLENTCGPASDALCTSSACQAGTTCLDTSACNTKP